MPSDTMLEEPNEPLWDNDAGYVDVVYEGTNGCFMCTRYDTVERRVVLLPLNMNQGLGNEK